MKKIAIFILSAMLSLLAGFDAAAQWYLFDINPEKKEEVKPEKPVFPENGIVKFGLMLPLQSKGAKPSENFMDMYNGALLAVRELAVKNGMKIDLQVIDTTDPDTPVNDAVINENDMILGPVSYADVEKALQLCQEGTVIISPLDPKTGVFAGPNLVQSPSSWQSMVDEMILWLREETAPSDDVIVILDSSSEGYGEQTRYLMDGLRLNGVRFRTVSGVNESDLAGNRNCKVIIASDADAFITPVLKQLSALATKHTGTSLFCTSRIRSSSGMNLNDLYNANARLTAPYHIDYNSEKVREFILSYRALFQNEPSSFAFQGYDAVRYYLSAFRLYGRNWAERLAEISQKGLQSDFRFNPGGKTNVAARRVIYNRNLTTTLQQ